VSVPVYTYIYGSSRQLYDEDTRRAFIVILIICENILLQFLIDYFPLQVKNKPHDGVANCTFFLELGTVTEIQIQTIIANNTVILHCNTVYFSEANRRIPVSHKYPPED
jgi:hypothetical protein